MCITSQGNFVQQQQPCIGYEGERRRMPQSSQVNPESLLNALSSSNSANDQDGQTATDSPIHDEVTRAAKTLFSKRNRTLMHWLKPNISKNQLKVDVNATWDCLPQCEKVFYISQVLGKFAPHTTSLMVNPQLEPTKTESLGCIVTNERRDLNEKTNLSSDSACSSDLARARTQPKPKVRRTVVRNKVEQRPQKRKVECSSEDEVSCDSGMVMDREITEKPVAEVKIKRKYSKRKPKTGIEEEKLVEECSNNNNCSPLPVKVSDIKKEIVLEPEEPPVRREKRKYIKRKLVRKKYKKREPKNKTINESPQEATVSSTVEPEQPGEDMDIWIELSNDADLNKEIEEFRLLEDEVDNFWDNIDDPNNLFIELEIE
uniref:Uncharacterized protein n=1 Tax=Graphocephala atropunctata TaxID=36148 RepID=A0A1B6LAK9_9HEMI